MDYKMRKIILEQDVCPQNTEIARFASRFRLKVVLWSIFFLDHAYEVNKQRSKWNAKSGQKSL